MAEVNNPLLQRVYGLTSTEEAEQVYDEWAETYDSDTVGGMGYVAPALAAEQLAEHLTTPATVLDAGCGTGLAGAELANRVNVVLDGVDLSQGMLDKAAALGVYRSLQTADLTKALNISDASYDGLICVGTLTGGHVGPDALDEMIRVVRPGGVVVATVHESVWEADGYPAHLDQLVQRGVAHLRGAEERPYHEREGLNCRLCTLEVR